MQDWSKDEHAGSGIFRDVDADWKLARPRARIRLTNTSWHDAASAAKTARLQVLPPASVRSASLSKRWSFGKDAQPKPLSFDQKAALAVMTVVATRAAVNSRTNSTGPVCAQTTKPMNVEHEHIAGLCFRITECRI